MCPPVGSPLKSKLMSMYLPKRLELSLRLVLALPKASRTQLDLSSTFFTLGGGTAWHRMAHHGTEWHSTVGLQPHGWTQDTAPLVFPPHLYGHRAPQDHPKAMRPPGPSTPPHPTGPCATLLPLTTSLWTWGTPGPPGPPHRHGALLVAPHHPYGHGAPQDLPGPSRSPMGRPMSPQVFSMARSTPGPPGSAHSYGAPLVAPHHHYRHGAPRSTHSTALWGTLVTPHHLNVHRAPQNHPTAMGYP